MITIYGYPKTRSIRNTWMMEELGQEYHYSLVDFAKGESKAAAFLAINPAGKVPAMQDDDLLLVESAAINNYLGEKFNNRELTPEAGTAMRARFDQWCFFALCELEQPLWTIGKHKFALPKEHRITDIFPTASWEYQQALELLSRGLKDQPYILGETFSAADILLVHTLVWGSAFKQEISQANVQDYLNRCTQRAAFKAALARDEQQL